MRMTKASVKETIREQANFNARMINKYLSVEEDCDRQHRKDMLTIYVYELRHDMEYLEAFGYITWEQATELKDKIWEYAFGRLYREF